MPGDNGADTGIARQSADMPAVYPERRNLSPKVRAFIDFPVERLALLGGSLKDHCGLLFRQRSNSVSGGNGAGSSG